MSTKAIVVWLVLAVVLGIAALVALRPSDGSPSGNQGAVGAKLLSFKPGEVRQIIVRTPGVPTQTIEQPPGAKGILGADAAWQLRIDPATPADKPLAPWPLESAKLQSLLRVLSEMRSTAVPAADAQLGACTTVELRLEPARTITLKLAERTLAGSGLIEITAPPAPQVRALVNDQVHGVFTSPGPREWREQFPLAGIAPDASRIRIIGRNKPLALARTDGQWFLREPVQAPADPAAVQRLLSALSKIGVADYLDKGVAAANTGLDSPSGSVTIEADRRTIVPGAAEPKVTTDTLTLTLGGAVDAGAKQLFCQVGTARAVLIDSIGIREIGSDPGAIAWPHPLREAPGDIGHVAITLLKPIPATTAEKTFKRSDGRWVQVIAGNADVPLAGKEQRDVDALLLMLTGAKPNQQPSDPNAATPSVPRPTITVDPPSGYQPIGAIAIGSLSAQPIQTIELGIADKGVVVLRTGALHRGYASGELPELLRAAVQAGAPSAIPPPMVP